MLGRIGIVDEAAGKWWQGGGKCWQVLASAGYIENLLDASRAVVP